MQEVGRVLMPAGKIIRETYSLQEPAEIPAPQVHVTRSDIVTTDTSELFKARKATKNT